MTYRRDREEILAHVHGLFDAYLRKDRPAIRAGHTDDWCGFAIRSRSLVRGIDAYLVEADALLADLRVERYEMLDTEVEVHGDLALVYYLARDFLRTDGGGNATVLLRALDVYRREPGGTWNQCGSNICALPEEPPRG